MKTKIFKNFTPHNILLNSGEEYISEGIARVSASFTEFDSDKICCQKFGQIEGLPEKQVDTYIIVSSIVTSASDRSDLVVPATGHPDCKRNEKGHIISVPGFIKKGGENE